MSLQSTAPDFGWHGTTTLLGATQASLDGAADHEVPEGALWDNEYDELRFRVPSDEIALVLTGSAYTSVSGWVEVDLREHVSVVANLEGPEGSTCSYNGWTSAQVFDHFETPEILSGTLEVRFAEFEVLGCGSEDEQAGLDLVVGIDWAFDRSVRRHVRYSGAGGPVWPGFPS